MVIHWIGQDPSNWINEHESHSNIEACFESILKAFAEPVIFLKRP